ncbi:MAG: hypothetical protein E7680_05230 [Ruminococcaceae bacterium]|nr:hypothetical protein [Oscillospiraceae bacterium]
MPRKRRVAFLCVLLALILAVPAVFCACSGAPTAEDLRADVIALLEAAPEINEVFFGAGLPVFDSSAPENADLYREVPESLSLYDVVDVEHSKFQSIEHIKAAALRVYSSSCISPLFAAAFEGVSSDATPSAVLVSKPYFVEQDDRLYQLRRSELDPDFDAIRERSLVFDYNSLTVNSRSSSKTSVVLTIKAHLLSEPSKTETKSFRLLSTPTGWKLNSWVL